MVKPYDKNSQRNSKEIDISGSTLIKQVESHKSQCTHNVKRDILKSLPQYNIVNRGFFTSFVILPLLEK